MTTSTPLVHVRSLAGWLTLLLAGVGANCLQAQQEQGKRYALLVGVNEYQHDKLPKLQYAVNDVKELAKVLRQASYQVTVLSEETGKDDEKLRPIKANIEQQLKTVMEKTRKGDLLLLAFTGHGLQFEDQKDCYFCPADARPFKDRIDTLLSLTKVYEEMERSFAGMKVLLVDACRNDPGLKGLKSGIDSDNSPRPPQGVAAFFSCRAGEQSREHDDLKHGVFFYHVLEGLRGAAEDREGHVTFAGLAAYVNRKVPAWVAKNIGEGAKQSPNLKADYSTEPVLLSVGMDPSLAEDLREYLRMLHPNGTEEQFFERYAGKRIKVWQESAAKGSAAGQFFYAGCLRLGTGVEKDERESARWYSKASEQGLEVAQDSLGYSYSAGIGVEKDELESARWYRKAAEQNYWSAQSNLGGCYMNGAGVGKDEREAFKWYRKAAEQGYAVAQKDLAWCYGNGVGVAKDEREAARWYRKAAEQNHAHSQNELGYCYQHGLGVVRNGREAITWYRKAALLGDGVAQWNLALCYEEGVGGEKDIAEAVRWYRKAADQGNEDARKALRRLNQN